MRVGDLLLTWNSEETPAAGRNTGWSQIGQFGPGVLWQQAPTEHWYGFPLQSGQTGPWHYWLLGELTGQTTNHIEAALNGQIDIAELNGHFTLWAWHNAAHQWHLWTNRLGTFHAYLGQGNGQVAAGTFCPGVAGAIGTRALDWYGLAGFFSWGFFPQDHTHFDAVRMLRPATHTILDSNGRLCTQERTWQWWHRPDTGRSYDDTVAEFADHFAAVMADQVDLKKIALPISGGLDSRTIAAAATASSHTDAQLWAYTYGYGPNSIETKIGRAIGHARNLPCDSFTIPPYLFPALPTVLRCVEGFQDVTQSRQAAIATQLRQNADVVLLGHWGDVWLDTMGVLGKEVPDLAGTVLHKLEKGGRHWLIDNFGLQQQVDQLHHRVSADLANYADLADPDFRVKAFKTDHWSWRWTTASVRMFQTAVLPRLPFYDNRLVDFFCTVPSEFVHKRRLQVDYLKRYAPDLARITWQQYHANLYQYQHFRTWLLPARLLRKLKRRLAGQQPAERNWEVQFFQSDGPARLRQTLLMPGLPIHEFVRPAAIEALLAEFYAAPLQAGRGYSLSMLLTLASWLEQYG